MRKLSFALFFLLSIPVFAVVDPFEFSDESTRDRYQKFIAELRCPKCQNQNLADSNSPISSDLRTQLHRLLEEGSSDAEIVEYMVSRYGDYILYNPPIKPQTLILWAAPLLLFVCGAILVAIRLRHSLGGGRKKATTKQLADSEYERLQKILKQQKDDWHQ